MPVTDPTTTRKKSMPNFLGDVLTERQKADDAWPPINSHHEGYAVLLEEVEEYWEIVRQKAHMRDPQAMYWELVQVAAVAWRIVLDMGLESQLAAAERSNSLEEQSRPTARICFKCGALEGGPVPETGPCCMGHRWYAFTKPGN